MSYRTAVCRLLCIALIAAAIGWPQPDLDTQLATAQSSYSKGDYAAALADAEEALRLADDAPADDSRRYTASKLLARILSATGDYVKAEEYLQQAIDWGDRVRKDDASTQADDLTELALLCRAKKDHARAFAIFERVLSILARSGGVESLRVADHFGRVAQTYLDVQDLERAAGTFEIALRIRTKLQGSDHPGLVPDLDRLATVRITMREYERAEATLRRALVIRERLLGRGDPDLIATLDSLGYACFGQKKFAEAEEAYKRVLSMWEASAGSGHPMVALLLDKLALLYRDQKRFEEGDAAASRGIAIRTWFLATGLNTEAGERLARGEKVEAAELYRRALSVMEPERPEYAKLRKETTDLLLNLDPPKSKPVRPPSKKPKPR